MLRWVHQADGATTLIDSTVTYRVPAANIYRLEDRIAKLTKRAEKLGLEKVGIEIVGEDRVETVDADGFTKVRVYKIVRPIGGVPVLNGWTFVATLQDAGEAGVMVRQAPGQTAPEIYRSVDPTICDHCNYKRIRLETFVLRHEDGSHKQVGRNCMVDFIGTTDAELLIKAAEFVASLREICDDEEGGEDRADAMGGPRYDCMLLDFLTCAVGAVKTFGWVSSKMAWDDGTKVKTSEIAAMRLAGNKNHCKTCQFRGEAECYYHFPITDEHKAFAEEALEWGRDHFESKTDYEHNMRVVLGSEMLLTKGGGLAASLIPAYQRYLGKVEERKAQALLTGNSEFIGEVGTRIDMTLKVLSIKNLPSDWGVTSLHTMMDNDGNVVIWFASDNELEVGKSYALTCSIKDHKEYNGTKQTVVNRCKAVVSKEMKKEIAAIKKEMKGTCPNYSELQDKLYALESKTWNPID